MPSTYSTLLGFQLPATSEQTGVWGNSTNLNFGKLIEQAIAGATVLDLTSSGGAYTPNDIDGAVDQSRSAIYRFTGTPGTTTVITVPTKAKVYTVRNDTDGLIHLKTAAQVGYVEIGLDEATIVYCDGAVVKKGIEKIVDPILPVSKGGTGKDTFTAGFVKSTGGTTALDTVASISLSSQVSGVLPVTNGGTGVSSFTSGSTPYSTGTTAWGALVGTAVGDYIVSNGTSWSATTTSLGGVESFNGRTGAVTPQSGDYSSFYALTNGSNASGTWSISISGNCSYASSAGSVTTATTASSATSITGTSSNGYSTRSVSTSSSGSGLMHYQYQ